jgi:hypothetical protein
MLPTHASLEDNGNALKSRAPKLRAAAKKR